MLTGVRVVEDLGGRAATFDVGSGVLTLRRGLDDARLAEVLHDVAASVGGQAPAHARRRRHLAVVR